MAHNPTLLVLFVAITAFALAAAIPTAHIFFFNLRQPVNVMEARIASRRIHAEPGSGWSPELYLVTFATETGDALEYAVRETEYTRLVEGQTGVLRTQGDWYRGFKRR